MNVKFNSVSELANLVLKRVEMEERHKFVIFHLFEYSCDHFCLLIHISKKMKDELILVLEY